MDMFGIASSSMALSQSQTLSQVGMAVMGMSLDNAKAMAASEVAALDSMPGPALERSVNPAIGGNFDMSV